MKNNELTLVKNIVKEVFIDITVKQMLNPHNRDFYIGTLTLAKTKSLLKDADEGMSDAFWTAFGIAQAAYLAQKILDNCQYHTHEDGCPECGCTTYVEGCVCPNCDYIED
jgi:hypothetical protein